MYNKELVEMLTKYKTRDEEEENCKERMLHFIEESKEIFRESNLQEHITGSCWIINKERTHALLTYHTRLNKWLQLGGHIEENGSIVMGALKEAQEESGLKNITVILNDIFDIDIHEVPKYKEEIEHYHYDVRFLFEADSKEELTINDESKSLRWISLKNIEFLTQERAILRMIEKIT